MRILYGVCGEGMGHASIASEVIPFLERMGHTIKVFTYGKGISFLKDFDVYPIRGLLISYEEGKVNRLKTIYSNMLDFPKNFLHMGEIKKVIEDFKPEICISDNEPIVAQTAYLKNIPLISFSALNTFVFSDVKKPFSKKSSALIAKAVTRAITPRAQRRIAISFSDKTFNKGGVTYTSPVIRTSIRELKPRKEDFIVVYLAKSHDYILKILDRLDENFVVYGMQGAGRKENIIFRRTPETFAEDLGNCKAIISNSGFSVVSEAIYLKKPIFMIPIRNQYEQFYNCLVLQNKKIGEFSERPTEKEIKLFLENLERYEKSMKNINFDPDEPLRVIEDAVRKFEKK
nr:hypothetical protein [uncultured archaeon]